MVKVIAVYDGKADLPYKEEVMSLKASEAVRFYDFKAWYKLNLVVKEFKPDVVQANAGDTLKYAVLSKLLFKWKAPVVSRNASEVGRYLKSTVQKSLNSFFYKRVDHIISVSEASQKDILKHFPFLKGRTEVIPVGIEERKNIIPVELKPIEKKHIIHVGGFSFEKNHQGLLKIFEKVLQKNPEVQLHLIGGGPLKVEIEKKVQDLKLEGNISFYGYVENPLPYIKAADVLVLPSIIEGLPGVLLEAMYCETAVIAYDVGGISEIVSDTTGTLIKKNNEEEFAKAIINTLEWAKSRQTTKAHQMVKKHFMNEQIALKFVNSYEKIATQQQ